jgi:hypothetical protein
MDSISMLNRIPKRDYMQSPNKLFTERQSDLMHDFQVDWGKPVVVKKPKEVASDLTLTWQ